MKVQAIQITDPDMRRLRKMLEEAIRDGEIGGVEAGRLRAELDRAKVVDPRTVSAGLVTMHSTVELLDLGTGEEETCTLVFPEEANASGGRVSVLAPIGTAVLGYHAGDVIVWEVPSGTRQLEIKRILYQPQAAGDFHL